MSQRNRSDGAHKGFAVGRGLLAAAETLNFSMNDRRPLLSPSSRPSHGMSSASGGGDGRNRSNTMKLFHSLGLSPADIDALAQIPEENISLETLPQLIMQLKNRKLEAGRCMGGSSRDLPPISTEFRASRDDWEDVPAGLMGRDRQYTGVSRDRYGGLGMGPSPAHDSGFLPKRLGPPSQGRVEDFLGVMPHMFPHVCSLCDFDVHSMMEWTQHTNGLRHAKSCRQLLEMYPDWDPRMDSNRMSGLAALDDTRRSDGLLGPAPMGLQRGGMSSDWGSGMSNLKMPLLPTPEPQKGSQDADGEQSRVVFFSNMPREREKKFELLTYARRFGYVQKYLFLKEQAMVEFGTPEEAETMVKYYAHRPLTVKGRKVQLNICEKYKTLVVNKARHGPTRGREDTDRKGSSTSRKGSPKRHRSESTSKKSSKSKAVHSEKDEESEAGGSTVLGGVSGEEISGVIEAGGDDYDESADKQEGEQAEIPDEAMIEPGESSTQEVEPVPDIDETQTVEEGSEVPTVECKKTVVDDKAAPAESEVAPEDLGAQESANSIEPTESTQISTEEPEEDQELPMDQDVPENMEDFVTLDEVAEDDDEGSDKTEGLRVVRVWGRKRGYNFVEEVLALAKPFGKVVGHLVLDTRPEAFLELSSEEEAKAMVAYYSSNVTATVCGRSVKVYLSRTHPTVYIGRVVYIGHIPLVGISDASILKLAEPFGKVRCYFFNRPRCECFIEMEKGQDALKMANAYKENPPKLYGRRVTVYVSQKYKQLRNGIKPPPSKPPKREHSSDEEDSPAKNRPKKEEEPPAKKACIREEKTTVGESNRSTKEEKKAAEEPSSDGEQQQRDEAEKETSEIPGEQEEGTAKMDNEDGEETQGKDAQRDCGREAAGALKSSESEEKPSTEAQIEKKPAPTSLPLEPYQPNTPVGVECVKMGYYCRVCFLFYSNVDTAKNVHCCSQSHYQKLKKHLEKEKKAKDGVKPQ
ncbi:hypothetical protein GJAV_G00199280 [Gymnothorax javanicus]|nr:hypothetical protein GJAV_G00199280 [Gymnothorax javanicus]